MLMLVSLKVKESIMVVLNRDDISIQKTADSGQCFRMNLQEDGSYIAAYRDISVRVKQEGNTITFFCSDEDFQNIWSPYFDIECDYSVFHDRIPKDDFFLNAAKDYSQGIRMLRQDTWETLISFILSQRKNIPAIKSSVEKLCEKFGVYTGGLAPYAFPEPYRLAAATDEELKSCGLGYRVPYVKKTADIIYSGKLKLDELNNYPNDELLNALCTLPGVGIKVASCVMLFAYRRLDIFPRDVWIKRVEEQQYNGHFDESIYKDSAGLMQQYMFYFGKSEEYKYFIIK